LNDAKFTLILQISAPIIDFTTKGAGMIRADEEIVRKILQHYEDTIFQVFHGGWSDFRELPLGGRLLFLGRTRACLVHDFIVQRAIAAWDGDANVRVIRRDETAKFVIANQVLLRFKKADDRGLGSNIPTQASMDFIEQQQELPGIPNVHKVEVVYVLNRLQTQIDRIVVVARDGDERLWDYVVTPAMTADVVSLPFVVNAESDRGARIKVRKIEDANKKESGE
jgi:hypothetical protein